MAGFLHQTENGVEFLTIPAFTQAGFLQAFSTRLGGVSTGGRASLNLASSREPDPETATENIRRFCRSVGCEVSSLVLSAQTHTDHILRVDASDRGTGLTKPPFRDIDALISIDPSVTLMTFHADCAPVFLADPVTGAVGLIHAGWRGTAANIAGKTVRAMEQEFGCVPADLLAAIGPSAGPCCYEVSEDVGEKLAAVGGDCLHYPVAGGKPYADLWAANEHSLITAGVSARNITVCGECTVCNELFYSHRRQGADRGTMAALLAAKGRK